MRDCDLQKDPSFWKIGRGGWPAVYHSIRITGADSREELEAKERFIDDLSGLFDLLQAKFELLPKQESRACGQKGIAVDIVFDVNIKKKEIILDRIYKYCNLEVHIFKELSRMLRSNFPDYVMIVPTLEGYQLAEEINRHLGNATIECIYLKGDEGERLLMGDDLQGITFENILRDTNQHYDELGGVKKKEAETRCGFEISMYHINDEEEEVLWMQIKAPIKKLDKLTK